MTAALIRSPESIRDVENVVRYFMDQKTPATAIKFGKAVMKTLNFLARFPEIGSPWESSKGRLEGVRFQNVRGFRKHLIFYRLTEVGLHVMRVFHAGQNIEKQL
jgi:toxin ParE1/3/4